MKLRNLILVGAAVVLLVVIMGCGGGDKKEAAATPPATETTNQVAETHDCDGGCGMTNVPMDKLTEIDGKFYCQGCANKVKAAAESEAADSHADHGHG